MIDMMSARRFLCPLFLAAESSWLFLGLAALALGYALGSVSFGILIPRIFGGIKDIRMVGSGNAGTTNVLRTQGKKQALLVFLGDMLKGMAGTWLGGLLLAGSWGAALAGFGTVLGHSFPAYFNFKGGKGVATGVGTLFVLSPKMAAYALLVFILVVLLTRWVSLGSIMAAASLVPLSHLLHLPQAVVLYSYITAVFVIWRHRSNIRKLLSGTESKLGKSRSEGKK